MVQKPSKLFGQQNVTLPKTLCTVPREGFLDQFQRESITLALMRGNHEGSRHLNETYHLWRSDSWLRPEQWFLDSGLEIWAGEANRCRSGDYGGGPLHVWYQHWEIPVLENLSSHAKQSTARVPPDLVEFTRSDDLPLCAVYAGRIFICHERRRFESWFSDCWKMPADTSVLHARKAGRQFFANKNWIKVWHSSKTWEYLVQVRNIACGCVSENVGTGWAGDITWDLLWADPNEHKPGYRFQHLKDITIRTFEIGFQRDAGTGYLIWVRARSAIFLPETNWFPIFWYFRHGSDSHQSCYSDCGDTPPLAVSLWIGINIGGAVSAFSPVCLGWLRVRRFKNQIFQNLKSNFRVWSPKIDQKVAKIISKINLKR